MIPFIAVTPILLKVSLLLASIGLFLLGYDDYSDLFNHQLEFSHISKALLLPILVSILLYKQVKYKNRALIFKKINFLINGKSYKKLEFIAILILIISLSYTVKNTLWYFFYSCTLLIFLSNRKYLAWFFLFLFFANFDYFIGLNEFFPVFFIFILLLYTAQTLKLNKRYFFIFICVLICMLYVYIDIFTYDKFINRIFEQIAAITWHTNLHSWFDPSIMLSSIPSHRQSLVEQDLWAPQLNVLAFINSYFMFSFLYLVILFSILNRLLEIFSFYMNNNLSLLLKFILLKLILGVEAFITEAPSIANYLYLILSIFIILYVSRIHDNNLSKSI